MKYKADVIILGAGASGMTAAGVAARRGLSAVLVERNERPGRKLMITGKGRCNLTNDCTLDEFMENVPWGGKFLFSAFSHFPPQDVMAFFEELGVPVKVERGRRVFPQSDKASDIVDALRTFDTKNGVKTVHGRATGIVTENGAVSGLLLEDGTKLEAENIIICTGGKSYPVTGSTGDGYELARQAGHTVTELRPSLVPVETVEDWIRQLQGLSLRNVTLEVRDAKHRAIFHELGEMLFTHFGVTGPLVLSASAHMRDMKALKNAAYKFRVDLKPALTEAQLDARLQRDFVKYANRDFSNSLGDLLPSKLIPVFVALSGIPAQEKSNQLTKVQRAAVAKLLKCLEFTAKGFRPIEEAVVTSGGVKLNEINPSTMESKLVKGLYFAGEILDADAYTGGYNLEIAFSTGFTAGMSVQS